MTLNVVLIKKKRLLRGNYFTSTYFHPVREGGWGEEFCTLYNVCAVD